jgi:hypothetical protein
VVPAAVAQSTPTDIDGVMAVCTPVIDEEYSGNHNRWGDCIAAVGAFLEYVGAPSDATNEVIADLVIALAELYRPDVVCIPAITELPQAIELAAQQSTDPDQRVQILQISTTIEECLDLETAVVVLPASPV